jgi:hypothetical protein
MSNKSLLTENTVRRFMKLASIGGLSNTFVNENDLEEEDTDSITEDPSDDDDGNRDDEAGIYEVDLEEEIESLFEALDEEPPAEGMPPTDDALDVGPEPEAPIDDVPDLGADLEGGADADMSLSQEEADVLIELGRRLESAMGGELGDEEELAPEEEIAPEEDLAAAAPAAEEEEGVAPPPPMQEKLVNEVLKRVTKRILKEKLKR